MEKFENIKTARTCCRAWITLTRNASTAFRLKNNEGIQKCRFNAISTIKHKNIIRLIKNQGLDFLTLTLPHFICLLVFTYIVQ